MERPVLEAIERATRPGPPRVVVLGATPVAARSVGLVAGSFDPMTEAHAALAAALGAELTLLVWSPATLPKQAGPGGEPSAPLLTPEARVASVAAWCAARPWARAAICSHGLLADQVEAAAAAFPTARLVLGLGSDKLRQLFDPAWYDDRDAALDGLFGRAEIAVAVRASDRLPEVDPRWAGRVTAVELPARVAGVSSRAIRAAVRRGRDVSGVVPPEVLPFLPANRPPAA